MKSGRIALVVAIGVLVALAMPVAAGAQTTFHVADSASLNMAITSAVSGDQIIFDANITLTSDLSSIQADVTIDGAGHTLSGNNQFRGLFITTTTDLVPVNVAIANLTIQIQPLISRRRPLVTSYTNPRRATFLGIQGWVRSFCN